MALTLEDFNKTDVNVQKLRMDAFQPASRPSPAANEATINTIASYGAALDLDGQIDSVYKSISNQLSYSTSSNTLDAVVGKWRENDIQGSMDTMRSILINPDIPDEEKQSILYGWQTNQQVDPLAYNVGISAAMAEDPGENGERSQIRERTASIYHDIIQYNAWQQKEINALNSEQNPAWHENVKSMVESFIPFADAADQAFFESIISAEGSTNTIQTLTLLGEGKERLRTTLAKVPLEERQRIVQGIINTIRSTSGSVAGDAFTLKQIKALEDAIVPGAYGNNDRWVDNVFSVLDDTVVLAPFSKALRGLRTAGRGADQARVAGEVEGMAARSAEAVAENAPLPRSQSLTVIPQEVGVPMTDWVSDVDNIVDSLPIEPTGRQINDLRSLIAKELDNQEGFSIDNVIDQFDGVDQMTSTQIDQLRGQLGVVRDKRTSFLNTKVDMVPASISEVRARHVSSNVQPTSIAQIYKDTNISKARLAHNVVVADETDAVAQKLYGTTRQNALAHDYLPEIGGNGRVVNKIEYDEAASTPDPAILKHVEESSTTSWADAAEKAEAQKAVINDFKNTMGITNRSAMASIENLSISPTDNGVKINQVYGPKDGGFSNAFTALDITRAALRKYGVGDSDITILGRQKDGTYAPVGKGTDLNNGDFLVQVDYDYRFDPKDVTYSGYDVSPLWSWLRIPTLGKVRGIRLPDFYRGPASLMNKEGGTTQMIVPKSVNIDPRAYTPGVAAAEKAGGIQKQFLNKGKEFGDRWKKLPKDQQIKVDEYIRRANAEEIPFNTVNIRAQGISEEGVDVLARWKQLQDTIGFLENADVARTLRDKDFEMFEHRGTDTRLVVQPVAKSAVPTNAELYDVATDSFIVLSAKNIDDIYEKGGSVVRPRRPETINGRNIEFILNPNSGDGFSRRIRDDDRILGYRHGYYHVRYTDPFYITKRDPNTGKVSTIARAETNRDARIEAQRLNDTKDGFEYNWKPDNSNEAFDNHLDVAINSGRSAQRLRGKRLERVGGSNDKTISEVGLESPMDSLTRSIASISHRVSFRNVIDAEKRRWMSQYKDLVQHGKFPGSVTDIKEAPGATEARHAFRHIEQLQDGYVNQLDEMSKAFFSSVSELAGSKPGKGWAWVDKLAAKLSKVSPSATARLTAFNLFLAANPVRQLPLQALPGVVVVSSLNPTAWPQVVKQMGFLGASRSGVSLTVTEKIARYGVDMEEMRNILEDYELSGLSAAVNSHSFRSDQMARLADRNVAQQAATFLGKPLDVARTVGFDLGEQTLMDLVFLSERNRMVKGLGGRKKLTGSERDQLVGKVRALTGDMNKGGDMPYNSNSFSVVMQFMQTPHKIASGLILGHRSLTGAERAKLATGYTLAFGIPTIPVVGWFVDKVIPPDNPEAREVVKGGLTNMLLNNFLASMSGEEVRVDFSQSLQPFSTRPMEDFVKNLFTLNMGEFVQGTAAASLIANDGRINRFVRSVIDWTIPGQYEGVDDAKQVGLTFMQMFSGVSNTMKAMIIMDQGKITTASGQTVDEDVSFMEALMKAAGFQTMDEVLYWAGNQAKWEVDGSIQKDIEYLVDDLFLKYTREGQDPQELEQYTKILRVAAERWKDNPAYMERVGDYYAFKMRQNPEALYTLMLNSGLYSPEQVTKVIQNSNFSKEQIETLMEMHNITGESYGR